MARHSSVDKKIETSIDRKRNDVLKRFFGLTNKVFKHIEWSLESEKICTACQKDPGTGKHKPIKAEDKDGKCAFCHGTYKIPDVSQRNWAAGELTDRISPKPKAVEMSIEKKDTKELEKELSVLSDSKLDAMLKEADLHEVVNGSTGEDSDTSAA